MIDPEHLRTLTALQRTGSISAAADELGYTPSAISQQLKRLERRLGAPVLDRVGRGVMLTELGRFLADEGAAILRQLEQLGATAAHLQGDPSGTVALTSFATAARGLVAPALPQLRATAPGLIVKLVEIDPGPSVEAVASGAADLAVVHNWGDLPLALPDHLDEQLLGLDRAEVLVHRDHPLARLSEVDTADLDEAVWVGGAAGSVCHRWLVHIHAERQREPDIRYLASEFETHIALVAQGLCIALVPRMGRETLPDEVRALPLRGTNANRQVSLIWRRSMAPSPAILAVRDAITRVAGGVLEN